MNSTFFEDDTKTYPDLLGGCTRTSDMLAKFHIQGVDYAIEYTHYFSN